MITRSEISGKNNGGDFPGCAIYQTFLTRMTEHKYLAWAMSAPC
jgi:hypothetical protein